MKTSILIVAILTLAGCVSPPVLEVARYKPTKGGVIKMPISDSPTWEKRHKETASKVMKRFCAPDRPEITQITRGSINAGSTTTLLNGMAFTQNDSEQTAHVHFSCTVAPVAEPDFQL